jgi:hypothetical protein
MTHHVRTDMNARALSSGVPDAQAAGHVVLALLPWGFSWLSCLPKPPTSGDFVTTLTSVLGRPVRLGATLDEVRQFAWRTGALQA